MKITSHFIGLSLDSSRFVDLFAALQQYFKLHDLEDVVEFQNILSTHITLYYLNGEITDAEKASILQDLSDLASQDMPAVTQLTGAYFGEPSKERVCYLNCPVSDQLTQINQFFAQKYGHSQVPENQLAFVAHTSLFRIHDPAIYAHHKLKVDEIIANEVQSIDCDSLVAGLHLFQVSSLFHPEIQIPVRT